MTGPTPPGTGEIGQIFFRFSKSISPTHFPSSFTTVATSISIVPFFTKSFLIKFILPAAEITISLFKVISFKSFVLLWHKVTTAFFAVNIFAKNTIDALLIARPLPPQLNDLDIAANINPAQDIDGSGLISMGRLFMCKTWQQIENLQTFIPCCPKAVMRLLDYHKIILEGKKVAVIGRSNTVGSPLAKMLTAKNATVTLCHSKTKELKEITLNSDIVISAAGKINLIKKDFVKKGTILIDVATVVNEQGKCVGDMDFENLKDICAISPVPGGVGPVTLACLLENIIISAERKIK